MGAEWERKPPSIWLAACIHSPQDVNGRSLHRPHEDLRITFCPEGLVAHLGGRPGVQYRQSEDPAL